jgi:hypothetical protein
VGQAPGIVGGEVDHKIDHGGRLAGQPPDTKAANLDQTGQRCGSARYQSSVHGVDMGPVVGHQPRKWDTAGACGVD